MPSYLNRYRFDQVRLQEKALDDFAAALQSGRLVAMVGSFATEECGYGDWHGFLKRYASAAEKLVEGSDVARSIEAIGREILSNQKDAVTHLSVIEEALAYHQARNPDVGNLIAGLQEQRKKQFSLDKFTECGTVEDKKSPSCPARVVRDLHIDRIITLNYDLEFEWEMMMTADERRRPRKGSPTWRSEAFARAEKAHFEISDDGRSYVRVHADGRSVISDIFDRDRPDRLIEFAVGSPDYEAHILHLHGRATHPSSMVVSLRDYNNQYRRTSITKLPFEHALRVMFAGNPMVFIGVGMSEDVVTSTLDQFMADYPRRSGATGFVLWNAPVKGGGVEVDSDAMTAIRFKWLHRFGLLTLFDTELSDFVAKKTDSINLADKASKRFAASITLLGNAAVKRNKPFAWKREGLRHILKRLDSPDGKCFDVWRPKAAHATVADRAEVRKLIRRQDTVQLVIGPPGAGRGGLSRLIREEWLTEYDEPGTALASCVVDANFVIELDSVLELVSALGDNIPASLEELSRRQTMLSFHRGDPPSKDVRLPDGSIRARTAPRKVLVIINGMERFISEAGEGLSDELDTLIQDLVTAAAALLPTGGNGSLPRLILLGTERMVRYFSRFDKQVLLPADDTAPDGIFWVDRSLLNRTGGGTGGGHLPSVYFNTVVDALKAPKISQFKAAALRARVATGNRVEIRRAFYSAYLDPEVLRPKLSHVELCLDILTVMAFIGQPIEEVVLGHCPRIERTLKKIGIKESNWLATIGTALTQLETLRLIIPFESFEGYATEWRRYGLHRTLITELRDRFGIPLSASKLSSGFNLSLYAAQLEDGFSPETDVHAELAKLVDWLIGAYRDPRGSSKSGEDRRRAPQVAPCLRAALAVLRSYYSTAALLHLDSVKFAEGNSDEGSGPLDSHAERLQRLIRTAEKTSLVRAKRVACIDPSPFYGDDLVWLHNELGVVRLAQGSLYEARVAFQNALAINRAFVEFDDLGPKWRHITLNQIHVDIERGMLDRADARITELKQVLRTDPRLVLQRRSGLAVPRGDLFEGLRECARTADGTNGTHDDLLTVGLITGYEGLVAYLRGQLHSAASSFETAIEILRALREPRALAIFQRHHASLVASTGDTRRALDIIRTARAAAESAGHADIAKQCAIFAAEREHELLKLEGKADSSDAFAILRVLEYAEEGGIHRLRVEALVALARIKLANGDCDAALEHASEALAAACRYGLTLRKIRLRTLIGRILQKRSSDRESGNALIERALRNGDRIGYQRAVASAQEALALG